MVYVRIKKLSVVLVCAILFSGLVVGKAEIALAAKNGEELKKQGTTIDKKIKEVKQQKKVEKRKLEYARRQSNKLKKEEKEEKKEYEDLMSAINSIKREEELLNKAISEAKARCEEQEKKLQVRIRAIYKNSNMSYVRAVAESKSFADLMGKFKIIAKISKADKELLESINNDRLDIEFKKRQKEIERDSTAKKASETKRNMERIKTSRAKVNDSMELLKKKLDRLERQEDELIKQSSELSKKIRELQGSSVKCQAGKMLWPLPSSKRITSPFGTRIHPIFKTKKTHHGIDIGAKMGSSILAAKNGKVIIAGWQGGYGNVIIIDHGGGITSVYAHCSKLIAKVGQNVKMGEVIAKVGSTGYSTGPHLHFEVRKNGTVVNPLNYTSM